MFMKRLSIVSLITSLMFIACSDDGDSSVNFAPAPTNVSSSSLMSSSSDVPYSETDIPVSSSSDEVSSSSVDAASSSSENASSSSVETDQPTFSKYISQFAELSENAVSFDSHVLAINAYDVPSKCADVMARLDEKEDMIFLNSVSEENIAECFPKTAPLLSKKFASEMGNMKFYAVIVEMGENPTFAVLSKFAADVIYINVVHPGGNCILETWGPQVMYLVADLEGFVQKEDIPITREVIQSEIWKCEDNGRHTPSVKNFGEWYSDSLL